MHSVHKNPTVDLPFGAMGRFHEAYAEFLSPLSAIFSRGFSSRRHIGARIARESDHFLKRYRSVGEQARLVTIPEKDINASVE